MGQSLDVRMVAAQNGRHSDMFADANYMRLPLTSPYLDPSLSFSKIEMKIKIEIEIEMINQ